MLPLRWRRYFEFQILPPNGNFIETGIDYQISVDQVKFTIGSKKKKRKLTTAGKVENRIERNEQYLF